MNNALKDVLEAIDKAKGSDTVVYRFHELNPLIDYVVITSATNTRQLHSLADYVKESLLEHGHGYRHIEGNDTSKWLLVDSDDIVIHIFEESEREVYGLEKLYANCERVM